MRFRVLGPLEVTGENGEPLPISGAKERTILAHLIARAGHVVPVDDLIEEVWGEEPPRTAEKTLGSYVSRLRRALDPGRSRDGSSHVITTRSGGYLLAVEPRDVDALRFQRLAEDARRLLEAGRTNDAGSALEEALELWRGSAYQEYRYTGFGTSEGERLEELRRSAMEDWIDTRLADGDAAALIADIEAMVRGEPLRERRWGQLLFALYRAGRQGEALQAFTRARTALVDELGVEPGPELQRLQAAILAQDPALERRWPGALAGSVSPRDVCPYKGLARFETADAEFFFGREQVVAEAVGHLIERRFLALVGASGSGKSSLMRAGLLHALGSGAVPGSEHWAYVLMRPGEHPLGSLSAALEAWTPSVSADGAGDRSIDAIAGSRSADRSVLAVDQFEETFTACTDVAERTAFLDALSEAALVPDGEVTVVLAMRADFYARCAEHEALASLLAASQILLGPMKEDGLRRAIELPAERAGLTIEDPLTDALVAHTVNQPGGLPLLSTALLELWTRRRDRPLPLDDYLRSGGVEGAVARLAEEAFGRLDADGQASAKRILLRLAGSGEGDEVVRRRAPLTEFDLDRDPDASRALAALTGARLVTVAEGTAEVAHEALLRDWPRLRTWLDDDAEGRRLHLHVTASAHAWEEGGRDDGDLYRGARLTAVLDWAEAHEADPNELEWHFLRRSRTASEGEAVRARRTNRLLRALLAGVAVLLVLSLIVGSLALRQRDDARAAADIAYSRQLAARSLGEEDLIVSLLLAREAIALDDSAQTRNALLTSLQRDPAAVAVMHTSRSTPGDLTEWLQLSPDGDIIAAGGARTTVDFFDAATYQLIEKVDVPEKTTGGDFSSDGRTLAVAAGQRIIGIDVNARTVGPIVTSEGRTIDAVLFAPNGGPLFTAESSRGEGFLVPRDPVTLEPSGNPVPTRSGPITAMDSFTDGRWLVTTGLRQEGRHGFTAAWRTHGLEQMVGPFPVGGNDVAVSPDGRTVAIAASASGDGFEDGLKGHLVLLDLRTGKQTVSHQSRPHPLGPGIGLTGVAFSPDGRSVISTGDDHRVLIWNASSVTIEKAFVDPAGLDVFTPALSLDGATLFTIDVDGNVVAWDVDGDRRLGRSFTAGSGATYSFGNPWFAISPDGGTLAITQITRHDGSAGSVRLVDTSTLEPIAVIPYNDYGERAPEGLAFSPDGKALAVTSLDGYIQLWDARTGRPQSSPFQAPGSDLIDFWTMPAFSPDGSVLATGGANWSKSAGVVYLWDAATGRLVGQLPEQNGIVYAVNFSPDGRLLVVSAGIHEGGEALVWNLDENRLERVISADDSGSWWADISNDGTTLVTGGRSSGERFWDLSTGESLGPELTSPPVNTVDLSPDGRTLVAAGKGEVIMWDVATATTLGGSWLTGPGRKDQLAAAFTPNSRRVFIVSATGEAWVWDVDPTSWEARACRIAGRPLTQAEWRLYLPDRPYEPACGP
jgi:WD40 repeat protein/DNA-binding SARP family transcriptional activator